MPARYTIAIPDDYEGGRASWLESTREQANDSAAWWIPVDGSVFKTEGVGGDIAEQLGVRFLPVTAETMSDWATVLYDTERGEFLEDLGEVDGKSMPWPSPQTAPAPLVFDTQAALVEFWTERQQALKAEGRIYAAQLLDVATGEIVARISGEG
jgi:hypothetical protein